MSIRAKGLVLAMEEDMEVIDGGSEELAESMADVVEDVSEVEAASSEVADYDGAIDDANSDVESLEKIHDVMAESVEKGEGLDETAAEIAEVAIESICARLGIKDKRTMPAMESFGSANSRVVATKIAMEGINDRIKQVWEAIKAAFKKVWDYIVEFYKKYMTALGSVKRAHEALAKEVKSFSKTGKAKDIENKSLATALVVGSDANASTAKTIISNHIALTQVANSAIGVVEEVAKSLYSGLDKIDTDKLSNLGEKFIVSMDKRQNDVFIGQTSIQAVVDEAAAQGGIKGFFINLLTESKEVKKETIPALTSKEMKDLIKDVDALLKETEGFVSNKSKLDASFKAFFKGIDSLIKSVSELAKDGDNDSDIKEKNKAVEKSMNHARTVVSKMSTMIPTGNVRAAKTVMQYINASMKAYE